MAPNALPPQRIADMSFLADLQPFLDYTIVKTQDAQGQTVEITIGDLTFVSAQSVSSTVYILPSADNVLPANIDVTLFNAALNDNGQGLAAGSVMTRGQTNWLDSNGKLGANEVFIGVRCGFEVFKIRQAATNGATGAAGAAAGATPEGAAILLIPNVSALQQIAQNLSWTQNVGDTIERNNGMIADYPQGFGVFAAPAAPASATPVPASAAQNGAPWEVMRDCELPLVFYPTIRTAIKLVSGNSITLQSDPTAPDKTLQKLPVQTTALFSEVLAVRMTIDGYKATSPV